MNSMKLYLAFWLSGIIVGVVLVERWRRRGETSVPATPEVESVPERSPLATASKLPPSASNLVDLVVTGAKLDVASVRQWSKRRNVSLSDNTVEAPARN
jgi:hypothetical protein